MAFSSAIALPDVCVAARQCYREALAAALSELPTNANDVDAATAESVRALAPHLAAHVEDTLHARRGWMEHLDDGGLSEAFPDEFPNPSRRGETGEYGTTAAACCDVAVRCCYGARGADAGAGVTTGVTSLPLWAPRSCHEAVAAIAYSDALEGVLHQLVSRRGALGAVLEALQQPAASETDAATGACVLHPERAARLVLDALTRLDAKSMGAQASESDVGVQQQLQQLPPERRCPQCGRMGPAASSLIQDRSADEGASLYWRSLACGHTWRA